MPYCIGIVCHALTRACSCIGQEQPEQGGEVQLQHQPEPPVDPVDNAQGGEQGEAAGEEEGTLCVKNTSVALNPEQDPVAHSVSDSEAGKPIASSQQHLLSLMCTAQHAYKLVFDCVPPDQLMCYKIRSGTLFEQRDRWPTRLSPRLSHCC